MELLVKPRSGFTADLLRYVSAAKESSVSFLALFTGPHGVSEEASDYESILVLASGSGIAAAIPYLKKMIYGYNTCTSQVRRLHLVWQVESVDKMTPALSLINSLLKDDIMDDGYVSVRSKPGDSTPDHSRTDYYFRYCISRFTSATASSRMDYHLADISEFTFTKKCLIIKALFLSRHPATRLRDCPTLGTSTVGH
jgi:hypothetical protein